MFGAGAEGAFRVSFCLRSGSSFIYYHLFMCVSGSLEHKPIYIHLPVFGVGIWNPVVSKKQSAMLGNQYGPWNWYKFHDQVRPSPGNSAGDCLQALFQPLESNVSAQSEIGDRPGLKDSWTGHTALLIQENFCKPRLSEVLTSLIFGKLEVLPVPTV